MVSKYLKVEEAGNKKLSDSLNFFRVLFTQGTG